MMSKVYTACLLAVLLGMGQTFVQEVPSMLLAGTRSAAKATIPPMDTNVPETTQTATVALG